MGIPLFLEDMKKFVEDYPEFRKLSGNVSKHVAVMSELSKLCEKRRLMDVSMVEQSIANKNDHNEHLRVIKLMKTTKKKKKKKKIGKKNKKGGKKISISIYIS